MAAVGLSRLSLAGRPPKGFRARRDRGETDREPPLVLTEIDIVAHVLWEMTYAGYDEARIQSRYEELRAMADSSRSDDRTD